MDDKMNGCVLEDNIPADASKCEWVPTNDIKLLFASSYVPINNNNNNGDNEINNNNNCDNDIMNHNGSSKDEFISKDDTKKDSDNKENEEEEEEEEDGKDSITQDIYCRHSKLVLQNNNNIK